MSNRKGVPSTRYVPPLPGRRVLGIDLGGARMATTGYVLLQGHGEGRPQVADYGILPRASTAERAERRLLQLIVDGRPDVLAVDAPLTLPPCLTCPAFCGGPGRGQCELRAAEAVWAAGGNPVTERLTEVRLRSELESGPLPTMRIGQIAARGVALARRILAGGTGLGPPGSMQVLEVYPYASLVRLAQRNSRWAPRAVQEEWDVFAGRVLDAFTDELDGVKGSRPELAETHVLDALVAAYTGWLAPDRLQTPPDDYNVASGWIWLPKPMANAA